MSSDRSVIDLEGVPDAAEWRQLDALAIRARLPLEALRDGIEPFPTFIDCIGAALEILQGDITTASAPTASGARCTPRPVPARHHRSEPRRGSNLKEARDEHHR